MEREFLQLDIWDQLKQKEAEEVARTLAKCLPKPWKFEKVQWHELGDQKRWVAFFTWKRKRFALIPGGKITLGYDQKHLVLTREQLRYWKELQEAYGFPALATELRDNTTKLRQIKIQPYLLETTNVGPAKHTLSHEDIVTAVTADGFRLPTSDEWEHACAGGSRTYFRWGDQCPDNSSPAGNSGQFKLHRLPNAFGLTLPHDTAVTEATADPNILRGGDGGVACCGGYDGLPAWLSLGSAHQINLLLDGMYGFEDAEPHHRRAFDVSGLLS